MSDKNPLEVAYEALMESMSQTATAIGLTAEAVGNDQQGADAFDRAKAVAVLTDALARQVASVPILRAISTGMAVSVDMSNTQLTTEQVAEALNPISENPLMDEDDDDDDGRPN